MARFPMCDACRGEYEVTMRTPEAVKIQLVCSMRPLTAGMPGGHLALKTREGMFNLASAVAIGGDLDIAVSIQNRGVKATRG
jgi:hypothetical protein